jgi:PEP-utilising enzyme, PEP-binding domain
MRFLLGLNGEPITDRVSDRFSGVGLIRSEYVCRTVGAYITDPLCQEAVGAYVARIADLYAPDPVWYRLIEMETSEINTLPGADRIVEEKTTMLGLRGIRRALLYPDTFRIEAAVVAAAARTRPNLHILLPFVHDPREVEAAQAIAESVRADMGGGAKNAGRQRPRPEAGCPGTFRPGKSRHGSHCCHDPTDLYSLPTIPVDLGKGGRIMHGITAEQLGRAVGMRLALALLAEMQQEQPGGRYPKPAIRARAAATLRDEQEAWAADGPPLPEAARAVALETMMDLLEAVIER